MNSATTVVNSKFCFPATREWKKKKKRRRKRWNENADAESKPTLNDKSRLKNSIIGDDFTYSFQHKKPQEGVN